jgi:hypothetical protein
MEWRLALLCALVLLTGTACPMWWGKGGFIDRASRRDLEVHRRLRKCPLDGEAFAWRCSNEAYWEARNCPLECRE